MLGVHLFHDEGVIEFDTGGALLLGFLEEHLWLLEAALGDLSLSHLIDAIVKVLSKGPWPTILLEEAGYFIETAADVGSSVDEVAGQEGISLD